MSYQGAESRYRNVDTVTDASGNLLLAKRIPYRYRERTDNRSRRVGDGETWFDLAEFFFWRISGRACGLFWVLTDYQVPPVLDPTIPPRPNSLVVAPSDLVVINEILRTERAVYQ